jgi:hypothetical protein
VDVAEEPAGGALWSHIHMYQLPRLCLSLKILVCHCVDLGPGVAHRVAHEVIRSPRARSTPPSAAEQPLPPHRKAAVVVAVLQIPVVVEAIALEVESRRLRLRLQPQVRRRTLLLHPQPRILRLCRLVLAHWLVLS